MTEDQLQEQIKALRELVEIQKQTIEALKTRPAQIQYVYPQQQQMWFDYSKWQWTPYWSISPASLGVAGGGGGGTTGIATFSTLGQASTSNASGSVGIANYANGISTDMSHPNNQNYTHTALSLAK